MRYSTAPVCEKRYTSVGTYWASTAGRDSLRGHLRDLNLCHFKQADVGGDQESSFEQAFSSLGYSYLKDKAPRLLDFLVGFQLVERNEDNTKAMGLFGFKVGDQWLYMPVFFLNGDLKGHELLYVKKQDTFVPLKENWVNYLIARKPHSLGEGSQRNTFELGGLMPNLTRLAKTPTGTKYGADTPAPIHIDDWAMPALPMVCAAAVKAGRFLYGKQAADRSLNIDAIATQPFKAALMNSAASLDLRNVLTSFPLLKTAFEKCYMSYPLIKQGFDRFYGPNFFKEMASVQRQEIDSLITRATTEKRATSYIVPPKKKKPITSLIAEEEEKPQHKNAGLTIFALDVDPDAPGGITENLDELDDAERKRLLNDTVLIKDKRDSHATSVAYNTQVRQELTNPDVTGLYKVLEKPGSFDEMLVVMNPHTGRGQENFCLVVRKSDPRAWKNADRGNIWAQQNRQPTDTDFRKWVDGLGSAKDLQKGGNYLAISPDGEATCPFRIRETYGDDAYKVEWHDHVAWGESSRRNHLVSRAHDYDTEYSSWNAKLWVNKRKGSKLRSVNGELSIPDTFKILKLKDPPKPKKPNPDLVESCCNFPVADDGESAESPIQLGNLADVQLLLYKQAKELQIIDRGANEIWLKTAGSSERMSKRAALLTLIRDHGLREEQAQVMLKEAAVQSVHNRPAKFLVKYGYGYGSSDLQRGAPGAPAIPPPMMGTEQNGPNAVSSIYPQEEFMPVDGMNSQQTDPSIYDPFYQPDSNAMQVAQSAAQQGQKEVFDTSMVSGLLRSMGKSTMVEKYIGPLIKALDKIGRLLMLFFWHQEDFEERYGKEELPELEDSLRNTFEGLGDLVLFLKEREVGGDLAADGSVGHDQDSEPSVSESARN